MTNTYNLRDKNDDLKGVWKKLFQEESRVLLKERTGRFGKCHP